MHKHAESVSFARRNIEGADDSLFAVDLALLEIVLVLFSHLHDSGFVVFSVHANSGPECVAFAVVAHMDGFLAFLLGVQNLNACVTPIAWSLLFVSIILESELIGLGFRLGFWLGFFFFIFIGLGFWLGFWLR
jgi:hypothetical protein